MTVLDLIIQLQQLPPNMTVMVDLTSEKSDLFHFREVVTAEEITTVDGIKLVAISATDYEDGNENLN